MVAHLRPGKTARRHSALHAYWVTIASAAAAPKPTCGPWRHAQATFEKLLHHSK